MGHNDTHTRRRFLQAVGAGAAATAFSGTTSAVELTVGPPGSSAEYESIQAAVDDATAHDTIRVAPGTYTESVSVTKPIHLVGDPGAPAEPGCGPTAPVLDGEGRTEAAGFDLHDPQVDEPVTDVTIEGFEIRNFGVAPRGGEWGKGIAGGPGSSRVTIRHNTFGNVGSGGIAGWGNGRWRYDDWTIAYNRFDEVAGTGIVLTAARNLTITHNAFSAKEARGSATDWHTDTRGNVGIWLHATIGPDEGVPQAIDDGEFETVEIAHNTLEGPFDNAGIYLLAINKNPESSSTTAAIRDVHVHHNVVRGMTDDADDTHQKAFRLAANPYPGPDLSAADAPDDAPPRVRIEHVVYEANEAVDDDVAFTADTYGDDAIRNLTYRRNTVRGCETGFVTAGRGDRSISGVVYEENAVADTHFGHFVRSNDPAGAATERAIADLTYRANEVRKNGYGFVFLGDGADELDGVALEANHVERNAYFGVYVGGAIAADAIALTGNDVVGNGHAEDFADVGGVANYASGTLTATCNFWGHATGPTQSDNEPGQGDVVVGAVDYAPWLPQSFEQVPEQACHVGEHTEKSGTDKDNAGRGNTDRGN